MRLPRLAPVADALTAVERFGGALNMNVHFHVLLILLDGVRVETEPGRVAADGEDEGPLPGPPRVAPGSPG